MGKEEKKYILRFPPELGIPDREIKVSDMIEKVPVYYKRDDNKTLLGVTYTSIDKIEEEVPPIRRAVWHNGINYIVDQVDYLYDPKMEITVYLKEV